MAKSTDGGKDNGVLPFGNARGDTEY